MRLIQLVIDQFEDLNLKENFKRLADYIQAHSLLHGFKFVSAEYDAAVTGAKVKHGLGFVPTDVVLLKESGAGSLTFNYDDFTATEISVTTTGACSFRAFVGSYDPQR